MMMWTFMGIGLIIPLVAPFITIYNLLIDEPDYSIIKEAWLGVWMLLAWPFYFGYEFIKGDL
jgi:predicted metal-binding membrane protein